MGQADVLWFLFDLKFKFPSNCRGPVQASGWSSHFKPADLPKSLLLMYACLFLSSKAVSVTVDLSVGPSALGKV